MKIKTLLCAGVLALALVFNSTTTLAGPGGLILHKPTGSKTLEYKRRQSRVFTDEHPEKVREWARQQYEKQKKKWNPPTLRAELKGTFRDGTGMVKFLGTREGKVSTHREL
jgi:hypothetical protein